MISRSNRYKQFSLIHSHRHQHYHSRLSSLNSTIAIQIMSSPSSSEMPPIYDTIILGAGFAGLTAARRIAQLTPARILILEARDRIGGRVLTANNFDTPVDVGASWIHGWREGNPVKDLCEELGIVSAAFLFLALSDVQRSGQTSFNRKDFRFQYLHDVVFYRK